MSRESESGEPVETLRRSVRNHTVGISQIGKHADVVAVFENAARCHDGTIVNVGRMKNGDETIVKNDMDHFAMTIWVPRRFPPTTGGFEWQ